MYKIYRLNLWRHLTQITMVISLFFMCALTFAGSTDDSASWPSHGGDIKNSRSQSQERIITVKSAPSLKLDWVFSDFVDNNGTHHQVGDITQTPTVKGNRLYFTD